jgi:hypothetical protein
MTKISTYDVRLYALTNTIFETYYSGKVVTRPIFFELMYLNPGIQRILDIQLNPATSNVAVELAKCYNEAIRTPDDVVDWVDKLVEGLLLSDKVIRIDEGEETIYYLNIGG